MKPCHHRLGSGGSLVIRTGGETHFQSWFKARTSVKIITTAVLASNRRQNGFHCWFVARIGGDNPIFITDLDSDLLFFMFFTGIEAHKRQPLKITI